MRVDRVGEGVRTLRQVAAGVLRARGVGIVRADGPDHLIWVYDDALGASAYRAKTSDLPEQFRPGIDGVRSLSGADLDRCPQSLAASRLRHHGMPDEVRNECVVEQLFCLPVPHHAATFMVSLSEPIALDAKSEGAIGLLAEGAIDYLDPAESTVGEIERLRKLEAVEMLLPSLIHALDVRELFDRLSEMTRGVLHHDLASLGVLSDDLEHMQRYVQTGLEASFLPTSRFPVPRVQTEAFLYRFVDDMRLSPLERHQSTSARKGRSTVRVAVRLGERVLGVLGFTSFDVNCYTAADLNVAQRIASHVAVALSYQELLEESRRAERLRERTANLDMQEELLTALSGVLDIREAFDRLSTIAQTVLPHDAITLAEVIDDGRRTRVHAMRGLGERVVPFDVDTRDVRLLNDPKAFKLVDELQEQPEYATGPGLAAGMRSMMVVAIRLEGRHYGGLAFYSKQPKRFTRDDASLATRIADHMALALSHQKLAEESRRSAALQERAANLQMLDGLLQTLTGVLDIRDVFDRVSAIADKVLPHDALSIAEMIGDGETVRIHASHGLGKLPEPYDIPTPDLSLITEPWDYRLIDDALTLPAYASGPGPAAGMRSMMFVSIRFEGRLFGGVNFYSKQVGRYTRDDVLVARRITDHVALAISHRKLADQVRHNEELRSHGMALELLDELLIGLIDSGDLPDVFGRICEIAKKVLAHDSAVLMVREPDGRRARLYAGTALPATFPTTTEVPHELVQNPDWEFHIYDDLRERGEQYRLLLNLGIEALLRVPIRLEGRFAGALIFFSKSVGAFKTSDVLFARRMADRLALTIARDRQLAAARRADEASERANQLELRVRALTEELDARTGFRRVVGESKAWRQVLTQATQVAVTDTTVLLLGESGTGKEVVARFLHRASSRAKGPFIALNCAALPEQLLEAELFGYERGAFTGATQSKPGQLEQAAGGTLFLDEVGEMSPSAQAKFLRVLQEKEFQRLGGTRVLRTDARIVAATNRDLPKAITQGHFREDLYYRLHVFAIHLPPLRERLEDVLPLSEAFLAEISKGLGRPPAGISRDARKRLAEYPWPGNVRELRNILERAAILCEGGLITADHLAVTVPTPTPRLAPADLPSTTFVSAAPPASMAAGRPASAGDLRSMERGMIEDALQTARFNKSKAAKALGLTRQQLYVRMRKYGLE